MCGKKRGGGIEIPLKKGFVSSWAAVAEFVPLQRRRYIAMGAA